MCTIYAKAERRTVLYFIPQTLRQGLVTLVLQCVSMCPMQLTMGMKGLDCVIPSLSPAPG